MKLLQRKLECFVLCMICALTGVLYNKIHVVLHLLLGCSLSIFLSLLCSLLLVFTSPTSFLPIFTKNSLFILAPDTGSLVSLQCFVCVCVCFRFTLCKYCLLDICSAGAGARTKAITVCYLQSNGEVQKRKGKKNGRFIAFAFDFYSHLFRFFIKFVVCFTLFSLFLSVSILLLLNFLQNWT